jgi:hypothetical protein
MSQSENLKSKDHIDRAIFQIKLEQLSTNFRKVVGDQ